MHVKIWIGIMLGGAIGATARYATGGWVQSLMSRGPSALFPWGTLCVNALGCLLMGFLFPLLMQRGVSAEVRMAVLVGLLGAFTTWSSFGIETLNMLRDDQWRWALAYVFGTNAACFLAVWLGYRVASAILG